jgi:glutamate racemase
MTDAPIGVFDSGIGGLTVMSEMLRLLPGESVIYLGDTARVPYGTRSPETVTRYAREGTRFLFSRGIKMLVVACNTVSAVGLENIERDTDMSVVGVIEPGARAAVKSTANNRIGVIGTEATIRSGAYDREIRSANGDMRIYSRACPLFVPLVEEGWLEGQVPELAVGHYLGDIRQEGIDTLVLGCTHYPLLKPVISGVMGEAISLIDSATETARRVGDLLDDKGLLRGGGGPAEREFYVTDSPDKFRHVGERFLGTSIDNIRKVELEAYE